MSISPSSSDTTDEALLAACVSGERMAWDALIERYAGLVIGTARRSGASGPLADDVMQTVFAVLLRRVATIRDPAALPQWLIVTTKRTTWRLVRASGAAPVGLPPDMLDTGGTDPVELLAAHERAGRVRGALDSLADPCRAIVRALFFEQPTPEYRVIAERLDLPIGSLGPMRARCLRRLANALHAETALEAASGKKSGDRGVSPSACDVPSGRK